MKCRFDDRLVTDVTLLLGAMADPKLMDRNLWTDESSTMLHVDKDVPCAGLHTSYLYGHRAHATKFSRMVPGLQIQSEGSLWA